MTRRRFTVMGFLVILLPATVGNPSVSAEQTENVVLKAPITLQALFLEGLSLRKKYRLRINAIKIGTRDVTNLFKPIEEPDLSNPLYFSGKTHVVRLVIAGDASLESFRKVFSEEGINILDIHLHDRRNTFLNKKLSKESFNVFFRYPIRFEPTPCEEITRIVYHNIDLVLQEASEKRGQTDERISLGVVFDRLLREQIDPYLDSLDPVEKTDACFRTFDLLKELRADEVHGFVRGEYRIHQGLLDLLKPITSSIQKVRNRWTELLIEVSVVGYTDSVEVGKIDLKRSKTGVPGWTSLVPLSVYYQGCMQDSLTKPGSPVFLAYGSTRGSKVVSIRDNCELGAVRAYVAVTFLVSELGLDRIEYKYATGAVANDENLDEKNRRVNIELVIKAAAETGARDTG